jgi:hypothetical protein
MTESELQIIDEIARHQLAPNPVQRVLGVMGLPFEKALRAMERVPVFKKLPSLVGQGVSKALRVSVSAGGLTFSDAGVMDEYRELHRISDRERIAQCPLEQRDQVADRFRVSNALMIGGEGVALGAGASLCMGLPGAQLLLPAIVAADIAASMTLLARHACQVASSYGYSPKEPHNVPHVIASMVPYADHRDEGGFFAAKGGVLMEVRAASRFLIQSGALATPEMLSKGQAPMLVRLIQVVATRLQVTLTEKELAMLVPLAGAGLNGAINVAFQQAGHICSKDYFRRVVLAEKYGDETVQAAIAEALSRNR